DERWNLIETVAGRVAEVVLTRPFVAQVTVTVHKPQAPIPLPFGDVSVTLTRSRE
ncbi:MAG: dihydroneopterin aldolase, partial [Actinomycetota bacterium]